MQIAMVSWLQKCLFWLQKQVSTQLHVGCMKINSDFCTLIPKSPLKPLRPRNFENLINWVPLISQQCTMAQLLDLFDQSCYSIVFIAAGMFWLDSCKVFQDEFKGFQELYGIIWLYVEFGCFDDFNHNSWGLIS